MTAGAGQAPDAAADTAAGAGGAPGTAARLAMLAQAFEQRVDGLVDALDASWFAASRMPALVQALPPGTARRRVLLRLFDRWCGPLPLLPDLDGPAGRLGLLERTPLLARLCALALLMRPGALRCCVERRTRQALEQTLGPAFAALGNAAQGGAAVTSAQAAWTPLHWACMGYTDLSTARAWPHRSLRRLVRLALPAQWPLPREAAVLPPPGLPAAAALQRLEPLFAVEGEPA